MKKFRRRYLTIPLPPFDKRTGGLIPDGYKATVRCPYCSTDINFVFNNSITVYRFEATNSCTHFDGIGEHGRAAFVRGVGALVEYDKQYIAQHGLELFKKHRYFRKNPSMEGVEK